VWQSCTSSDKDSSKTLFLHKFFNRKGFADNRIDDKLNALSF
jgi:hypothetical protein